MEVAFGLGIVLLGKYRVESVLGQGGMGVVLKVTHLHLGEQMAMKVLNPESATSPDTTARFLREAQSAVRLRGEHVARVTDVGMLPEGLPFIVMEYLHGVDLAHELKKKAILPPGKAVDYVLQACEALAEAHIHGIVHRDVKPANLFLTTRPDGSPLIKVLDFGISKAPASPTSVLTQTEVVMGTPGYMSPEQMKAAKDVDARSDIWALGIVLYECLAGRRPFDGESFSATVLIAGTEPPPPLSPTIPRGLQTAVLRCLEKDRRARFPTIAELAAALAPFARSQREAATIVERTSLMLQRPTRASELVTESSPGSVSTTLSASAGSGFLPRRRRAITGGIWLLGCVAALLIAKLVFSGLLHASGQRSHTNLVAHVTTDVAVIDSSVESDAHIVTDVGDTHHEVSATAPGTDAGPDSLIVVHPEDARSFDAAPDAPPPPKTMTVVPVPSRPPPTHPPTGIAKNQPGEIVVRVRPWAEVWIDGKEIGTTPVREPEPAGAHKVTIANNGHREVLTVTVTPGSESVIERNW